jgi:hypothetical protein
MTIDKLELQLKAADKRLASMERAIEEIRKEVRGNDSSAKLAQLSGLDKQMNLLVTKVAGIDKQVAVLVANSFTRKDYTILEERKTAHDAASEAAINRRDAELAKSIAEANEFQRKEMKRLEAMYRQDIAKIEKIHLEQRLALIEANIKELQARPIGRP